MDEVGGVRRMVGVGEGGDGVVVVVVDLMGDVDREGDERGRE